MLKGWSQRLCVSDGTLLNPRDSKPRALTMEKLDGLHGRRSPHTPEPIPSDFVVSSPFLGLWVWIRRRGQCQRSNLPNPTTLSSSYPDCSRVCNLALVFSTPFQNGSFTVGHTASSCSQRPLSGSYSTTSPVCSAQRGSRRRVKDER